MLDFAYHLLAAFLGCLAAQFVVQRGWRAFRQVGLRDASLNEQGEMRCNHCGQTRLVVPCRHGQICASCTKLGKD